jgi:hypothetical protein
VCTSRSIVGCLAGLVTESCRCLFVVRFSCATSRIFEIDFSLKVERCTMVYSGHVGAT